MKKIDLGAAEHDLEEILSLAMTDALLLHAPSGEEFVVERADASDSEVAALGGSTKFMAFLAGRSAESEDLSLQAVKEERGL